MVGAGPVHVGGLCRYLAVLVIFRRQYSTIWPQAFVRGRFGCVDIIQPPRPTIPARNPERQRVACFCLEIASVLQLAHEGFQGLRPLVLAP